MVVQHVLGPPHPPRPHRRSPLAAGRRRCRCRTMPWAPAPIALQCPLSSVGMHLKIQTHSFSTSMSIVSMGGLCEPIEVVATH
eukprot:5646263-Alexandrium_andersonii.AAC.1